MGEHTGIEWTDHTFNPWWGCVKVSEACKFCYAEGVANRFGKNLWGPNHNVRTFGDKHWNEPLRWNRKAEKAGVRRRVFCASMADVFEDVSGFRNAKVKTEVEVARRRLWMLIDATPHLDWLLLTKRPENIMSMVPDKWIGQCALCGGYNAPLKPDECVARGDAGSTHRANWPANVMTMTTVEDQASADLRIPELLKVPGRHGLSMEPLREEVSLDRWVGLRPGNQWVDCCCDEIDETDRPCMTCECRLSLGAKSGIHWVIAGGESGPRARPAHPDWFRALRDQCAAVGIPYFFKQHGAWAAADDIESAGLALPGFAEMDPKDGGAPTMAFVDGKWMAETFASGGDLVVYRVGKKFAGAFIDGREHKEFPSA